MSEDSLEESKEDEAAIWQQVDGAISDGEAVARSLPDTIPGGHQRKRESDPRSSGPTTMTRRQKNDADKSSVTSWFAIPAPLKRVFDRFPLVTYSENGLPRRGRRAKSNNVLYVFTTETDARSGKPSFNPSCLKWQTYLRMSGVAFTISPSNNHASPNGSLPFLLVDSRPPNTNMNIINSVPPADIIQSNRLRKWAKECKTTRTLREADDVRYEAYASLLDNSIRLAWLYQLYLHPSNEPVINRLYVRPCTSNPLVQVAISSQLRSAARSEIVKTLSSSGKSIMIHEKRILKAAEEAFEALSTLLADEPWFFIDAARQQYQKTNLDGPSLFDASVFAYTHLILDTLPQSDDYQMGWNYNPLKTMLERYDNLVKHRNAILEMYY